MPLAIIVLVCAALWRAATVHTPALANVSPVMALAFCAGAYSRRGWLWAIPFAALLASDLYINRVYADTYHYSFDAAGALVRLGSLAAGLGLGLLVSRNRRWGTLLGGCLASSLVFYVATNTCSWAVDPGYAHSLAGWFQALTTGHPEFPPTYFFLRNSLVSDLAFTGLFAVAIEYALRRQGEPSLLALKQVRG
jgi:hypothetical protein